MSYSEKQLIAALRKLERNWPDGYTLFSWSGTLCLIKDNLVGHERSGTGYLPAGYSSDDGPRYGNAIVERFLGIPNDGGDPD